MSEFYKNELASKLFKRIEKDYIFSLHRVAIEKGIDIYFNNIESLDAVSDLDKSARPEALKQVFVELTSKDK